MHLSDTCAIVMLKQCAPDMNKLHVRAKDVWFLFDFQSFQGIYFDMHFRPETSGQVDHKYEIY